MGEECNMQRELKSDCSQCVGLCCVALPYAKSVDFSTDKDAGVPCHHLLANSACNIHDSLRENGFKGCVSYECFGAGQYVTQVLFEGKDWRTHPSIKQEMFASFPVVQQLHEMLSYLKQAMRLEETEELNPDLQQAFAETIALTKKEPEVIASMDLSSHRSRVNLLLVETSIMFRRAYVKNKQRKKRIDYLGAKLKGKDLRGNDFRGAWLITADLKGADLRRADFIGADLRDARLDGANLDEALFLTQSQINAATGNGRTRLPNELNMPDHWKTKS